MHIDLRALLSCFFTLCNGEKRSGYALGQIMITSPPAIGRPSSNCTDRCRSAALCLGWPTIKIVRHAVSHEAIT